MNLPKKIILGIDPGTTVTGYGVITEDKRNFAAVDYGCIRPPSKERLALKNKIIFQAINALIERFDPTVIVVERQFILKINPQSGLTLGMAAGVVLLAASLREIPVFGYAPTRAKLAIVGTGRATKGQVQEMVRRQLSLSKIPTPADAADALALALCYGYMSQKSGNEQYLF